MITSYLSYQCSLIACEMFSGEVENRYHKDTIYRI